MTPDPLLARIRPLGETQLQTLAAEMVASAHAPARSAVELALGPDAEAALQARRLLLGLEDVAVVPLLVDAASAPPRDRVFLATQAVEAELTLRRRVLARLDRLLDDRSPVPVASSDRMERKRPARRVCDEAFLLKRAMLHATAPMVESQVQADVFLNAPDDFKDQQINMARRSNDWNRPITARDIQDYAAKHPQATSDPDLPPASPGGLKPRR